MTRRCIGYRTKDGIDEEGSNSKRRRGCDGAYGWLGADGVWYQWLSFGGWLAVAACGVVVGGSDGGDR